MLYLKYPWNTHEIPSKHSWETFTASLKQKPMKHPCCTLKLSCFKCLTLFDNNKDSKGSNDHHTLCIHWLSIYFKETTPVRWREKYPLCGIGLNIEVCCKCFNLRKRLRTNERTDELSDNVTFRAAHRSWKLFLQNFSDFSQGVQNWNWRKEIQLSKQKMELFPLLPIYDIIFSPRFFNSSIQLS